MICWLAKRRRTRRLRARQQHGPATPSDELAVVRANAGRFDSTRRQRPFWDSLVPMGGRQRSFGPFVLDPERQALLRDGEALSIGHRGYLILEALLDADGETVSKTALLEHAWPGLVVEEANLTVQVGTLRKAMGADGETLIVTVPRAGYRLVRPAPAPASMPPAPAAATIAVMPFANLSGIPEQDYFADGMVDELITALSRFKTFAVVSRTSTFAYKHKATDIREAGRELGVRYVLEGSVRRAGDRLRVTAQLVDAETGAHLWAEKFDGATEDIFAFQDAITESVVGLVEPTIRKAEIERARRKRPESLDAYELFLKALPLVYGMLPQSFTAAIALLERAIEIDPTFAPALAFAAWTYEKRLNGLANDRRPASARHRALPRPAPDKALAAGADDPMVLGICGWLVFHVGNEHTKGLSAMRRSLAANPNNQVVLNLAGYANAQSGDLAEARNCFMRVFKINPGAPDAFQSLTGQAMVEVVDNNPEAAVALCQQSLATLNEWPYSYLTLAAAYAYLGRAPEASASVDRLWESSFAGLTLSALSRAATNRDARATGRWMRIDRRAETSRLAQRVAAFLLFGILWSADDDPKRRLVDAAPVAIERTGGNIMTQTRAITPFMAAFPGLDERILSDVGLDALGNVVDERDPRVRRLGSRRGVLEQVTALLSMRGKMQPQQS